MSTDREMLEKAAKAAKLPECGWMGPAFMYVKDDTWTEWNPLESDADAFRLAVKLEIEIYHADDDGAPSVYAGYFPCPGDERQLYAIGPHGSDPLAATRRAIVRAAAAIGEQMP